MIHFLAFVISCPLRAGLILSLFLCGFSKIFDRLVNNFPEDRRKPERFVMDEKILLDVFRGRTAMESERGSRRIDHAQGTLGGRSVAAAGWKSWLM